MEEEVTRITLVIEGKPLTKDNRAFIGKDADERPVIRVPKSYKEYERTVKFLALQQIGRDDRFPIPKPARIRVLRLEFHYPYEPTNNDLFNAPKSFCDALNGVLWEDDGQVWRADGLLKAKDWKRPRVEIEIEVMEA